VRRKLLLRCCTAAQRGAIASGRAVTTEARERTARTRPRACRRSAGTQLLAPGAGRRGLLAVQGQPGRRHGIFGAFLQRMGYPPQQLRIQATGRLLLQIPVERLQLRGIEPWPEAIHQLVRNDGMAPMLVGQRWRRHRGPHPAAAGRAEGAVPRLPFAPLWARGALLRWAPAFPGLRGRCSAPALVPASVQQFTGYRIAATPFTSLMGFGDFRAWAWRCTGDVRTCCCRRR